MTSSRPVSLHSLMHKILECKFQNIAAFVAAAMVLCSAQAVRGDLQLDLVFAGGGSLAGWSVSGAGDVNGDGLDDMLVAAPGSGTTYLFYGRGNSNRYEGAVPLTSADAIFRGTDFAGGSVTGAGDVNGDGLADILIGALNGDSRPKKSLVCNSAGCFPPASAFLMYGRSGVDQLAGEYLLKYDETIPNGVDVAFRADGYYTHTGRSVSAAGDLDGDGFGDFLIGASLADPLGRSGAGEVRLVYGRGDSDPLSGVVELATDSVAFQGVAEKDRAGFSVAAAGDVNGDGRGDLLIGAYLADPTGTPRAGEAYLIYGREGRFENHFDLASADLVLQGEGNNAWAGYAVSSAGDINGDGLADLLIGAHQSNVVTYRGPNNDIPVNNKHAGKAYVVFGRDGADELTGTRSLATADLVFEGARRDRLGISVSAGGDINGDGFDDLIVGATTSREDCFNSGWCEDSFGYVEVVYGDDEGEYLTERISGPAVLRSDFPFDVSSAGDVDGDGLSDFLIGTSISPTPNHHMSAFLVYGRESEAATGLFTLHAAAIPEPTSVWLAAALCASMLLGRTSIR